MPPEKQTSKWSSAAIMLAVGLIGAGSTQIDRLTSRGAEHGTLKQRVATLETKVQEHYESGCKPSIQVRADVSALKSSDTNQQNQLNRMENKIDDTNNKIDRLIERLSQ